MFGTGDDVELHGLLSEAGRVLNGQRGRIVGRAETGRYVVALSDSRSKNFKPENLRHVGESTEVEGKQEREQKRTSKQAARQGQEQEQDPCCVICLDDQGAVRKCCACRQGHAHVACLARAARESTTRNTWTHCPTCLQRYYGEVDVALAMARWEDVADLPKGHPSRVQAEQHRASATRDMLQSPSHSSQVLSPRTLSLLCIENTSVHRKGV